MIGGEDAIIKTFDLERSSALDVCLQILMRYWRHSVVQSGVSAVVYIRYGAIPLGKEMELMVYRDNEAFKSWNEFGALPNNRNTMVHVLAYSDDSLTVVSDDLNAADMKELLRNIRQAINDARNVYLYSEANDVRKAAA